MSAPSRGASNLNAIERWLPLDFRQRRLSRSVLTPVLKSVPPVTRRACEKKHEVFRAISHLQRTPHCTGRLFR